MVFTPSYIEKSEGRFLLPKEVKSTGASCLCEGIFAELWQNFSFGYSSLEVSSADCVTFKIGEAETPDLLDADYAISVEPSGIAVVGKDERELRRAFFTLLDMIKIDEEDDEAVSVDCCLVRERAKLSTRMVHFCVFPETELWELWRFVRLAAVLRYTHVIVEFWGMLKYDCLRELAWESAYSKLDIAPIVAEAKTLGVALVPMFNHWGHAAGSRVRHGKHVVLDQNPALESYFTDYGWCWDIKKTKVKQLLSKIRDELCDLFPDSDYFHVGCDEAYGFDLTKKENCDLITDYLDEINKSVKEKGRRLIVWGDMFIHNSPDLNPENKYTCSCPTSDSHSYLLSRLDRDIVIADWQYDSKHVPVETSAVLKNAGFDVMLCPWDRSLDNVIACTETAKHDDLLGIIHTTWHTLSSGMPMVTVAAVGCCSDELKFAFGTRSTSTAALLRKVYPAKGNYSRAGWSKKQIDDITT